MKKIFITLLTILYLLSGIGVGSVHHYCKKLQDEMNQCDSPCCSDIEISSQNHENSNSSCCHVEKSDTIEDELILSPDECCAIEHKYSKVNTSSVRQTIDISLAAKQSNEPFNYPQDQQTSERNQLTISTDPSIRLNLPLLI